MMSFSLLYEDNSWYYNWDKKGTPYVRGNKGQKDWAITPVMIQKYEKLNDKWGVGSKYWLTRLGVTLPGAFALHFAGVENPALLSYIAGHAVATPLALYWANERNNEIARNPKLYKKT